MAEKIKWGILGPGNIAHKFAQGLKALGHAELYAVGSRDEEKAQVFAKQYGVTKAYGSYEALAKDDEVDIVYVATPHPFHLEHAFLCLKHGKGVLCEKPFTVNKKELEELYGYARENHVFLMEAMWTRFLPAMVKLRELLDSGIIGAIKHLKADFCFKSSWNPEGRLLNPALGGGALLDVGVYVISLSSMVFKSKPVHIKALAHIGETGVDEQCSILLGYKDGAIASLTAAVRTSMPQGAWIFGTEGTIHIPEFWHGQQLEIHRDGETPVTMNMPFESTGYQYEALEAMECLLSGKRQSEIMSLDESLDIMDIMDQIRGQIGLKYPFE